MQLERVSPDVYAARGAVVSIGVPEVEALKAALTESANGRVRINLHGDADEPLHEMIIALRCGTEIKPHRHPGKSESFHLICGAVDVWIYDEVGAVREVVQMGGGNSLYYRLSESAYHTVIVRSDIAVLHETTNGPFRPGETEYAPWA